MTTMTTTTSSRGRRHPADGEAPKPIEKVSIIISKGSLDGVYPGLIMANGARMDGIEANVFFTFFGLEAITKKRQDRIKVATVGNPGMHMPTLDRRPARHVVARDEDDGPQDGEARLPARVGVRRDDRRLGRGHLRLQGERRHVRPEARRTSCRRSPP